MSNYKSEGCLSFDQIRVLSHKKIMIKKLEIPISIGEAILDTTPLVEETINVNLVCSFKENQNRYEVTNKNYSYLKKLVSKKYGIKMKYVYLLLNQNKFVKKDAPSFMIRYIVKIRIEMPESYYSKWAIRRRNYSINMMLKDED